MIFTFAVSCISLIPAKADAPCYSVVEGVLTDGSACAGAITIDSSVTSIGVNAFKDNLNLISIYIPSSVTSVGSSAFRGTSLTTVAIPGSVTTIESFAFRSAQLESISFGEGVRLIGDEAFYENNLSTLTIPNSVISIGLYAFAANNALTSITIGSGVTDIGANAFQDTTALTSISFLGVEPTVGTNAFFSTPAGVISYVPSTAEGFVVGGDGLWNGFIISRVVAPSITLTPTTEEKTVNTTISGYTITSTGDTITSFSISPAAPAGLTFSSTTGLLTGTPTTVSSATTYTITARNVGGVSAATFVLTVKAVAVTDNSAVEAAAAATAAAKREADKRAARADILAKVLERQDLTIDLLTKAEVSGITSENIADFQAEILNLPADSRSDISTILKIAYRYEIVGKISSDRISHLPPNAYVEIGLIPLMSKNKVALVASVKRLPLGDRKNYADIKAEIDKQIVKIQARKDRLAAVIDRNAKRRAA